MALPATLLSGGGTAALAITDLLQDGWRCTVFDVCAAPGRSTISTATAVGRSRGRGGLRMAAPSQFRTSLAAAGAMAFSLSLLVELVAGACTKPRSEGT